MQNVLDVCLSDFSVDKTQLCAMNSKHKIILMTEAERESWIVQKYISIFQLNKVWTIIQLLPYIFYDV